MHCGVMPCGVVPCSAILGGFSVRAQGNHPVLTWKQGISKARVNCISSGLKGATELYLVPCNKDPSSEEV